MPVRTPAPGRRRCRCRCRGEVASNRRPRAAGGVVVAPTLPRDEPEGRRSNTSDQLAGLPPGSCTSVPQPPTDASGPRAARASDRVTGRAPPSVEPTRERHLQQPLPALYRTGPTRLLECRGPGTSKRPTQGFEKEPRARRPTRTAPPDVVLPRTDPEDDC